MDPGLRELLQSVSEFGMQVEFFAMDDACPVCSAVAGKVFHPSDAPVIPVPTCEGELCRCDYLPVVS